MKVNEQGRQKLRSQNSWQETKQAKLYFYLLQSQETKGVHQRSNAVTGKQQQQRPESPTVTLTWHACKYKVHNSMGSPDWHASMFDIHHRKFPEDVLPWRCRREKKIDPAERLTGGKKRKKQLYNWLASRKI